MKQIYIGGCERSGTTMLGAMLGEPVDGVTIPESEFVSQIAYNHPGIMHGAINTETALAFFVENKRFRVWGLNPAGFEKRLDKSAAQYSEVVEALVLFFSERIGKQKPIYWVDHTPANLKNASTLFKIFPDARMIHIIRDGRAVAASLLRVDWGPKTIPAAACFWLKALAHCFSAEIFLGSSKVKRVKYEDILKEPEVQLRDLCKFCGIQFHHSMLEGSRLNPAFLTLDQHRLVGKTLNLERSNAWKQELTQRQIEIFESIAGNVLDQIGYETIYWPHAAPHRSFERYRLEAKEFIYREVINRWKKYIRFRRALSVNIEIARKYKEIIR